MGGRLLSLAKLPEPTSRCPPVRSGGYFGCLRGTMHDDTLRHPCKRWPTRLHPCFCCT